MRVNMRVVGCLLERVRENTTESEFLMVHRLAHKADGNTWGLPSGKVEPSDANDVFAVARELFEETGFKANTSDFELLGEYWGKKGDDDEYCISYPTYRVKIRSGSVFEPVLEAAAHDAHCWVTPQEAKGLELIYGLPTVFRGIGYWSSADYLPDEYGDDGVFVANE